MLLLPCLVVNRVMRCTVSRRREYRRRLVSKKTCRSDAAEHLGGVLVTRRVPSQSRAADVCTRSEESWVAEPKRNDDALRHAGMRYGQRVADGVMRRSTDRRRDLSQTRFYPLCSLSDCQPETSELSERAQSELDEACGIEGSRCESA